MHSENRLCVLTGFKGHWRRGVWVSPTGMTEPDDLTHPQSPCIMYKQDMFRANQQNILLQSITFYYNLLHSITFYYILSAVHIHNELPLPKSHVTGAYRNRIAVGVFPLDQFNWAAVCVWLCMSMYVFACVCVCTVMFCLVCVCVCSYVFS